MKNLEQLSLFSEKTPRDTSSTFHDNLSLPVHRWYRYSAGYSAEWVESVLQEKNVPRGSLVFDPFAGSGTTLLAAQKYGCLGIGNEAQLLVYMICDAKLNWHQNAATFGSFSSQLLHLAKKRAAPTSDLPDLITRCYTPEAARDLYALKSSYLEIERDFDEGTRKLLWLVLTSILRPTSSVGTAQWQYLLPKKQKKNPISPFLAFEEKSHQLYRDMIEAQSKFQCQEASVYLLDSRSKVELPDNSVDVVITSPPYPNNYDYADATRLELVFWDFVRDWSGLHEIRKNLLCSCSQHSSFEKLHLEILLDSEALSPIRNEISSVCRALAEIRSSKGGKKTYHTMIAAYYLGIARMFGTLRRVTKKDAHLVFVLGDSAPYGVYAPADRWFTALAEGAGFRSPSFEKIRDRNRKWKNRKHTVPLQEGRLWLRG